MLANDESNKYETTGNSSLKLHVRWARNLNEYAKNKGILKQSIDNGIFTNEIIKDMAFCKITKKSLRFLII